MRKHFRNRSHLWNNNNDNNNNNDTIGNKRIKKEKRE